MFHATEVLLHIYKEKTGKVWKGKCLTCLPNQFLSFTFLLFCLFTTQAKAEREYGRVHFCRTSSRTCPKIKLIWQKKIKLNQTPKCFITYLCFQPLRDCITKIWIIKDIWVLLRRREKKQSLIPYFIWKKCCYLWKVSDKGLWCVWAVKRLSLTEKYKGSVYIGRRVTPPDRRPQLNCLFTSWLLLQSPFSNSPKFCNFIFRIFHWLRIVAKIRFKTWLWLSVQIVEQLLVYARSDLYRVLPSLSDMHISHFWGSGVMMLPRLHQVYPFWPKPWWKLAA